MVPLNALTVDVEDYFHVAAFAGNVAREDWPKMPSRVEANTRKLLELFAAEDVKATFFVLGCVAEQFPGLVREIHSQGHEIACHGYSHRLIYTQQPEDFRRETEAAKRLLEDAIGEPVIGYRAASYSITADSRWAIDTIAEAGFLYDSSIVPVHHDLYGMPGAEPYPHMLTADNGRQFAEFPPSTVRVLGRSIPVAGGGYFRLYPYALTRYFLRSINEKSRQPFIFYLHPWEVDPDQPRIPSGLKSRFRHYTNLAKTEGRLRALIREFKFDNVREVLAQIGLLKSDGCH